MSIRIVRVRTQPLDIAELAEALVLKDHDKVGDLLDACFEFQGTAGVLLEVADGPLWDALAKALIDGAPELAERIQERVAERKR